MAFFNESKFNMWRACIAAIWADGKVAEEEKNWAQKKIDSLPFTDEQKAILTNELAKQADFGSIVANISDKRDRAFLAHQIRVISHLDDHFSDEEKGLLNGWREIVLAGVDLGELEAVIAADEKASYHEDEVYKIVNKNSIFERAIQSARKVLNPGDYKFPKD